MSQLVKDFFIIFFYFFFFYIYELLKFISKKNQADHVQLLIWPEWKWEMESQTTRHQKVTSSFCPELLLNPQYEFGDPNWRHENLNHQKGFVTRFLNGASQETKVKLNKSQLLKFYHVKQLKENSTENSIEKNFKEDSQFNEFWNILTKKNKKRKEKYSNSKKFVSRTLSQISSSKLHKNLQLYTFCILFILVSFV